MRIFIFLFIFCCSFIGYTQNSFSKEFSILSDNDLYTSTYRDRYYTNGLFLSYKFLSTSKKEQIVKKIKTFQIGHMMYTPVNATLKFAIEHDRPFAAYLFTEYGERRFYNSQNLLITDLQIGMIGPNAKGKELQDFIHQIYNYPKVTGWKHQIKNAFAFNLNTVFLKHFKKISASNFDANSISKLKVGTVFSSFSTGLYSRIGLKKLQPLYNSVAFNSNLNNENNKSESESFFYVKPMLNYIMYDATIQGSFLNNTSPVTFKVKPIVFTIELGYKYYHRRFLYGYTFHYHTKKPQSLRATKNNTYGSIYIGYYFN